MLKLTIYHTNNTGIQVRLKTGTKLNLVVKNPIFGYAGLFSYFINVYREENDRIFNYAAALDNLESVPLTFKLEVGTDILAEGEVKITESTDEMIEFYLKSGNSSVAKFMSETLMNKTNIWGSHNNLFTEKSIDGYYPDYPIIAPPIATEDGDVINYIGTGTYSAVYIRHLVNKLISALGYQKQTDVMNDYPDFDRLALFAFVHKTGEYPNSLISRSLPAVSILEWLTDLKTRFNTFIFFSPFGYEAEVLNISDCLNLKPVDWTNKFKEYNKKAPAQENQLYFSQDNEDSTHLLSYQNMKDNYDYITVNDMSEMTTENVLYYVTSLDRFMKGEKVEPTSLTTENPGYHFRSDSETFGGETYKKIKDAYLGDYSVEVSNSNTDANTLNFIEQFLFPEWDGECDYSFGYGIKVKTSAPATLVVTLVGIKEDGTITNAGYSEIDITSNTYTYVSKKERVLRTVNLSEEERLALRFYCKSDTPGAKITMQYGGYEYGTGAIFEAEGYINPPIVEFKEVGILGDVTYGELQDENDPIEYKPDSKIPVNSLFSVYGYLLELPQTNLSASDRDEQNEFEYLVYRGKKLDEQQGIQYTGYCNCDVLDYKKEDYTSKLEDPVSPSLSLAWRGEKGILSQLWKNRLPWERYFKKQVKMTLDLTISDILNNRIYRPFSIQGIIYITDEIQFSIDEYGEISNVEVTAYTL